MAERTFAMPDLGEGLEEGKVVRWLVAEGDAVELNQPLLEVETTKAVVEVPSPFAGRVVTLHAPEDADVPVGSSLVTFQVEGPETPTGSGPAAATDILDVRPHAPFIERRPEGPAVTATPPVRKLAKELGVDLEAVRGTGPGGRVIEEDVRRVAERIAAAPEGAVAVTVRDDLRSEPLPADPIRESIADTLTRQTQIPQVTTFRTLDATELQAVRHELGVSPLPVVVSALCRTIEGHPFLNAAWADGRIELRGKINVAIAVDTERGLMIPVLQDAGRRGIADLGSEIGRLADNARSGSLEIADIVPTATIAVSNTGSYGSEAGTPILSPGTSVTLAFGVIGARALVIDGDVVARPAATLSLTFDHRVLDGAAAGRALTDLVELLQSDRALRDLPR
jgi:pyruvate dehydrogenase E2 component (dihydrolipoamide acetyltransferase)